MVKVFAFDLDGTLTQHKTPLSEKNRAILEKLAQRYTLLMVGAGSCMRIHSQLGEFPMDVIGNYGMQYAKYADGALKLVRDDVVACENKSLIEEKVMSIRKKYGFNIVALREGKKVTVDIDPEEPLAQDGILIVLANTTKLAKFK